MSSVMHELNDLIVESGLNQTVLSMAARQGVDIVMALVHAELTWQFSSLARVPIID